MRYLVAAALLAAAPALAHEFQSGAVTIGHPVIYEGPPTLKTAAGYLTITNGGGEADSLIGVRAEGLRASLHESREADGVVRMSPVDIVEIPAGASVAFEPGGLHVMFMDVDGRALREGATLAATLVFDQAGEVGVVFSVEARTAAAHGDHGMPMN
jgi:copper(I)-binding protein